MAVRSDVTVDWFASPRLITVASPSVEITIQDLVDTCRDLEDELQNLGFERLIDAAGKEPLGGGVSVGITATLNNAVLAFEARPGPSWVLCTISGGNLVAVDSNGNEIDPRYPTAYTTIDRTSSSSATLQDLESIQAASYEGRVYLQNGSGYSGTTFPVGTLQAPVGNLADAKLIATERGLPAIHVIGDFTFVSGDDTSLYEIRGEDTSVSTLTFDVGSVSAGSRIYDATVTGTITGASLFQNCILQNVTGGNLGIPGTTVAVGCRFVGTTTLNSGIQGEMHLINCVSGVAGTTKPIFDINGADVDVYARNWFGGVEVRNFSNVAANEMSIDFSSGTIDIDDTCTTGSIILRGVGQWDNRDSYAGTTTVTSKLIDGTFVQQLDYAVFNNEVHVDQANGVAGTEFPKGTGRQPVNNVADAVAIANTQGIENLRFIGDYSFSPGENVALFNLRGAGIGGTTLTFAAGSISAGCHFFDATIEGTLVSPLGFERCAFNNVVGGTIGAIGTMTVRECSFMGTVTLSAALQGEIHLINCSSGVPGSGRPVFDVNGANVDVLARSWVGGMEIHNFSNAGGTNEISLDIHSGRIFLDDTCTTGAIIIRGLGSWVNKATFAGTATVTNELVESADVSAAATITRNKTITDPVTGLMTVYDLDDTTVLFQAQLYEDAAGTQTYRGKGAERREQLQ